MWTKEQQKAIDTRNCNLLVSEAPHSLLFRASENGSDYLPVLPSSLFGPPNEVCLFCPSLYTLSSCLITFSFAPFSKICEILNFHCVSFSPML